MPGLKVPSLVPVASVKFEILLPTTFIDPADPSREPGYVNLTDVVNQLTELTVEFGRHGGFTYSNPFAPPPFAGTYPGEPQQELSFWVCLIIPDHLLDRASPAIQQLVLSFQQRYHQKEILAYHYSVTRFVPEGV